MTSIHSQNFLHTNLIVKNVKFQVEFIQLLTKIFTQIGVLGIPNSIESTPLFYPKTNKSLNSSPNLTIGYIRSNCTHSPIKNIWQPHREHFFRSWVWRRIWKPNCRLSAKKKNKILLQLKYVSWCDLQFQSSSVKHVSIAANRQLSRIIICNIVSNYCKPSVSY